MLWAVPETPQGQGKGGFYLKSMRREKELVAPPQMGQFLALGGTGEEMPGVLFHGVIRLQHQTLLRSLPQRITSK